MTGQNDFFSVLFRSVWGTAGEQVCYTYFVMDIQSIKQSAIPILRKYGVTRASLFGSAVTGEMKEASDIDILVALPSNVHGFDYVALKVDLQEELELTLGKKVDVVEYNLIKPALKKYILPTQQQIL